MQDQMDWAPEPDDVAQLAVRFPGWIVGAAWVTAGTGPDLRQLRAHRDGITVTGWQAAQIAEQIRVVQPPVAVR